MARLVMGLNLLRAGMEDCSRLRGLAVGMLEVTTVNERLR